MTTKIEGNDPEDFNKLEHTGSFTSILQQVKKFLGMTCFSRLQIDVTFVTIFLFFSPSSRN